ncbi:MAG: XRE family transcriptional regulator [Porphyromonadaceae bacterium]|nr:MAG: XRE family transcriptional regulator [Porphyromonadaceae bacterium]
MKKIDFTVEKTNTGYSAYAEKHMIYTAGSNWEELEYNILEATNLYFEDEGKVVTPDDLRISLDLPQFFEFYKVINASALSERIKMNQSLLAQYISGHKKPSAAQLQRILKGIRQVGRELAEIHIIGSK